MRAPRRPRRGRPTDRCRTHVFHCRFCRGLSPRKITVRTDFKERAETEREASGAGRSRGAGANGKRRAGGPADSPRAATGGIPTEPDGAKARRPAVRGLSVRPGAGGAAPSRACRPCTCGGFRGRKPNEPHAEGRRTKDSRPPPDVHLRRGAKTSGTPLPGRTDGSPGIRRGSWGTQDGTAGRRSCLNAVFRALYVAEENYEVRTRKTHTGLGGNAILRFSSGNSGTRTDVRLLGSGVRL